MLGPYSGNMIVEGGKAEGKNTDVEIWRKIPDDYYSPAIHVTERGDIGIQVGGHVLITSVEHWFAAGEAALVVAEDIAEKMRRHAKGVTFDDLFGDVPDDTDNYG